GDRLRATWYHRARNLDLDAFGRCMEGIDCCQQHRIFCNSSDHLALSSAHPRDRGATMIANPLIILTGLWLSYRAIFSIPIGQMSEAEMMLAGMVVILLALWARRTDPMAWYSGTCVVLGLIVVALSLARHTIGVEQLVSFWMVL